MKSRDHGDELPAGVITQVFVTVAQMERLQSETRWLVDMGTKE
jgi:hypothetical protein